MKHTGHYVLAGLLVLATVPIYRFILSRRDHSGAVEPVSGLSVAASPSVVGLSGRVVMTSNESEALRAIAQHRAKCVAGIVYRTADHVIEPWPGHVACLVDNAVNFYGVSAIGV